MIQILKNLFEKYDINYTDDMLLKLQKYYELVFIVCQIKTSFRCSKLDVGK